LNSENYELEMHAGLSKRTPKPNTDVLMEWFSHTARQKVQ